MPATDRVHSPTPEELMAFLDGESPADSRAVIEAHVVACAECRQVISDLGGVNRAMAAWQPESAPATLRPPRVQRAMGLALPAFSWRPAYLVVSLGAVASTVLLVVNLGSYAKRASTTTPTVAAEAAARISSTDHSVDGRFVRNGQVDGSGAAGKRQPGGGGGGRPEPAHGAFVGGAPIPAPERLAQSVAPRQPSVIRTATLRLVAGDFNTARSSVESIATQAGGFLDQINVNGAPGTARTLTGSLRVPSARLGDALIWLRQLGQVTEDTQGSEDVTDQLVDLDARLANARATERRLNDILKNRTGKLTDVLEVEREISRVRLEIEQMDAQRVNTTRRVAYATITLQIDEVRKAGLESSPLSLTTRLRVAGADGLETAFESLVGVALFVLRAGPALLTWLAAGVPIWILARRITRHGARQTSQSA